MRKTCSTIRILLSSESYFSIKLDTVALPLYPCYVKTIGQIIREKRERVGWNITQLGMTSTLGREYISEIERGKIISPRMDTLEKIAKALNCQIRDLLPSEEFTVKEGGETYRVGIYPGLQRIDVHDQDEADSVHKLLLILRGPDESAKISIKGFLDTIIGLVEKKSMRKEVKLKKKVG